MTNAEKLKKSMDKWDCMDFYCDRHDCEECPAYNKDTHELSCRDLLAEWMEQEAKDGNQV